MRGIALTLTLTIVLPWHAGAQITLAPGPGEDQTTCAQFEAMDNLGQIAALSALPVAGDDIGAGDQGAAEEWAATVAAACAGYPDRPLTEAATAALGGD